MRFNKGKNKTLGERGHGQKIIEGERQAGDEERSGCAKTGGCDGGRFIEGETAKEKDK